ncbi:hypothetical protein FRC02_000557 [Tulasnella sp. 418]|nr:hypothetical protein FRC02_000557 [Tulasnella sp. 418]
MEFQEMAQKAGRYWARVLLWGRMAFGMTFILNILATTLICWKIWLISKNVSGTTKRMDVLYVGLVRALIESGAILTASIALYLIIISINPVAGSLVAASIPVAIGVAPTFCVMKIQLMADESHVTSEDPATTTVPVALQVSEPVWQTGRSTQLSPMAFALESVKTSNVATNWEDDHSSSPSKREVDLLPDLGQDHKPPTSLSLV